MALIQAVKLHSTAITRLLFQFGLLALVKAYLHYTFRNSLEKKLK